MNHATNCKFCKKPITIEIDDAYAALGDPQKLLPISTCDRCADLRVERRCVEDRVKTAALTLANAKGHARQEMQSRFSGIFERLLHDYARLIARWHYLQGESWDDAALETILIHPEAWHSVLETLWKVFKDANKERELI
jgi:hypothetical protein